MTTLTQRSQVITLVSDAIAAGARQDRACGAISLSERTLQRWQRDQCRGDQRPMRVQVPKQVREHGELIDYLARAFIHGKILEADGILHSVPVYFWAMTAQMKAYLDRWCAFFDGEWKWHQQYYPKMKGKRIGVITVCGDPNVNTADPIVHSFKNTTEFTKMKWIGAVMASAGAKGEIAKDEKAKKEAYELGRKAAEK